MGKQECLDCTTLQSKANLQRHIRVNIRRKAVSCFYCSEKLKQDCALKEHVKISHNSENSGEEAGMNMDEQKFCLPVYEAKVHSREHVKIYVLLRIGQCPDNCSLHARKIQRTENNLIQHERTHTKDRAFSVHSVHTNLVQENALAQHEATHKTRQQDKSFQCSISECRFLPEEHNTMLRGGQGAFRVYQCDSKFSLENDL
ncbi:zinc finger protein 510-like [Penaeus indicus]|uniref:zinc finger protein 510-like n=1 Tax=Penaeus indicus TaxID=29960 RepID=UPI00300D2108